MGKVITVLLQKGGVGKTTVSVTLAKMLHKSGYKVLGIDVDSQAHFTSYIMDIDDTKQDASNSFEDQNLYNAFLDGDIVDHIVKFKDGFDIVPGSSQVVDSYAMFEERDVEKETYLRDMLDDVKEDYDFIIIDSHPNFGELEVASIVAADHLLIVANPNKKTVGEVFKLVESKLPVIKSVFNPNVSVAGILMNRVSHNKKNHRNYRLMLKKQYPDLVLDGYVKDKVTVENILNEGYEGADELDEFESIEEFRKVFLDLGKRIDIDFKFPKKPVIDEPKSIRKDQREKAITNKLKYFFK